MELIKIPSLKLNIATLREAYREEEKSGTLGTVMKGAGPGFLSIERLNRP
jgi:hypothetical protein